MRYSVALSFGRSGRLGPNDRPNPDAFQNGRFGFWWFFWLPHPHYNGGRPWRREILDFTVNWLCFWGSITMWPKTSHSTYSIKEKP